MQQNGESIVPACIHAEHKQRLAAIYVRQSSPDQVRHHTGSTDAQRALVEIALGWGWPKSQIWVIEDDLGLSGTSSHQRCGFQQLLEAMDRGEVSIVFVREMSRLTRDPLDAERFLKKAIRWGVLIEVNGRVYDPASRDLAELFNLRIQGLLAWWENEQTTLKFQGAKEARIRKGYAVTRPPIGYVETVRGKWVKDPDPAVREAVRRLFDLYLELRSIHKVARWMRDRGLLFPKRVRGEIRWEPIKPLTVLRVLSNPNYTTDYSYRRRRLLPRDEGDPVRLVKVPPSGRLVSRDHHDPYLTGEESETIQRLLHGRGRGPGRRPPAGKGAALLQGLLVCAHCHNRPLRTFYDGHSRLGHDGRVPRYVCHRTDAFGAKQHRVCCSAIVLDRVIAREILTALSPVGLKAAIAVIDEEKHQAKSIAAAHQHELHRAQAEEAELFRLLRDIDPEHRHATIEIQAKYDRAVQRRAELEREFANTPPPTASGLSHEDATKLLELSTRLEDLWNAPTTTHQDRKGLIETVISQVVIHASTEEHIDIEIVWVGGLREMHRLLKPKAVGQLIVARRKARESVRDILNTLDAEGLTNAAGRPFSRKALQHRLWELGLDTKRDRVKALLRIRGFVLERRTRREMLEILNAEGPKPKEGEWTREKIASAIQSLREGRWADEVPPLPHDVPTLFRLDPEAVEIVLAGRETGRTFRAITEELNAKGLRPPRATHFTMLGTYQLYQHLTQQGAARESANPSTRSADGCAISNQK
jgi:DNA invertase Pin-like site-specific DNA recombinase